MKNNDICDFARKGQLLIREPLRDDDAEPPRIGNLDPGEICARSSGVESTRPERTAGEGARKTGETPVWNPTPACHDPRKFRAAVAFTGIFPRS